ncbi:hypothetical protein TNCV_2566971 [Trichonephila clavipes]|uniref:Uncharacterized protein n=1 Tax=Trichonephila clavipes TaxID=2585209 RepID=A0A8X7BMI5_TRICX|nr:hypothetical protein TNCV_2566971 [Trichonephila clavipes]
MYVTICVTVDPPPGEFVSFPFPELAPPHLQLQTSDRRMSDFSQERFFPPRHSILGLRCLIRFTTSPDTVCRTLPMLLVLLSQCGGV